MNLTDAKAELRQVKTYLEALTQRDNKIKAIEEESHNRFVALHYLKILNTAKANKILLNLRNRFSEDGTDNYPKDLNASADKHKDYMAIVP